MATHISLVHFRNSSILLLSVVYSPWVGSKGPDEVSHHPKKSVACVHSKVPNLTRMQSFLLIIKKYATFIFLISFHFFFIGLKLTVVCGFSHIIFYYSSLVCFSWQFVFLHLSSFLIFLLVMWNVNVKSQS